jgi:hypothetical protein
MAEPADSRNDDPVAGPGIGGLEPLVDRNPGAQDRRDLDERNVLGQMSYIVRIRHDIFGEASVHRIAGVLLLLAQRLPSPQAVFAVTAGGIEPGDADAVAFPDVRDAGAHGGDMTDAFVTRDERRLGLHRPIAVRGMQVGVADAARRDPDEDLAGAGVRHGNLLDNEGLPEFTDDCCFHGLGHVTSWRVMTGRVRGRAWS